MRLVLVECPLLGLCQPFLLVLVPSVLCKLLTQRLLLAAQSGGQLGHFTFERHPLSLPRLPLRIALGTQPRLERSSLVPSATTSSQECEELRLPRLTQVVGQQLRLLLA